MLWIFLVVVLSIIVGILFIKGVSKVRSLLSPTDCDGSVLDTVMDFPKVSVGIILCFVMLGLFQITYPMKQMYDCSIRSTVQKVETQYSWYFDVCQFKNKDGVWIDFKQVRGTPDSGTEE